MASFAETAISANGPLQWGGVSRRRVFGYIGGLEDLWPTVSSFLDDQGLPEMLILLIPIVVTTRKMITIIYIEGHLDIKSEI